MVSFPFADGGRTGAFEWTGIFTVHRMSVDISLVLLGTPYLDERSVEEEYWPKQPSWEAYNDRRWGRSGTCHRAPSYAETGLPVKWAMPASEPLIGLRSIQSISILRESAKQ